jgi:hypothetical protein
MKLFISRPATLSDAAVSIKLLSVRRAPSLPSGWTFHANEIAICIAQADEARKFMMIYLILTQARLARDPNQSAANVAQKSTNGTSWAKYRFQLP